MNSPVLLALAVLAGLITALITMLYALRQWAIRYQQAAATVDLNEVGSNTPPILNAEPAEIDEWTTEAELWLRLHNDLNAIEAELRDDLDALLHRFMADVGVDDAALVDQPGFRGVRELVGAL